MLIKNALVYTTDCNFAKRDVRILDGEIAEIAEKITADDLIFDAEGAYLVPGFINIHVHGAVGYDVMQANVDGLKDMCRFMLKDGTTSFLATTVTAPFEETRDAVKSVAEHMKNAQEGAQVLGLNIEGPYLNRNFKGAHMESLLTTPDAFSIDEINDACNGHIKLITIAPETPGAQDFTAKYKDKFKISLGHGGSDYEKSKALFQAGATQVTHLFNTMPPMHHRDKGLIHAAFEEGAYAELICDGIHVDKSVVLMAIKMFGADKICMITDGVHATGLADGEYMFCGSKCFVVNGVAKNENGNLVGGTSTMLDGIRNLVSWGVSLEDAIRMATANPADTIGVSNTKGRICVGLDADLVLLDADLNVKKVFKK